MPQSFSLRDDLEHHVVRALRGGPRLGAGDGALLDPIDGSGDAATLRWLLKLVGPGLAVPPALPAGSRTIVLPAGLSVGHVQLPLVRALALRQARTARLRTGSSSKIGLAFWAVRERGPLAPGWKRPWTNRPFWPCLGRGEVTQGRRPARPRPRAMRRRGASLAWMLVSIPQGPAPAHGDVDAVAGPRAWRRQALAEVAVGYL